MKKRIIVAESGTHGSGKGEVVKYLVSKGFQHFSARKFLQEELERRGMDHTRPSLSAVANDLRIQYGPEYVAFSLYQAAQKSDTNAIIESVYTIGEIEKIRQAAYAHNEHFILIGVDANPKIRYTRITETRKSETDHISFEEFMIQQEKERNSSDPTKQNLQGCLALADKIFINDGTLEDLHGQLDKYFGPLLQ